MPLLESLVFDESFLEDGVYKNGSKDFSPDSRTLMNPS